MAKSYVEVHGTMEINWTVELPIKHAREPVACDDPAIEAAMQGVSQHITCYLWGQSKEPAIVHCEVNEADVKVEEDHREG